MLHEQSELNRIVYFNGYTDEGLYKGNAKSLSSYSYHPFSEKYYGEFDLLVPANNAGVHNIDVYGRNKFSLRDDIIVELVQKVPHLSKKMGQNWWCWVEEIPNE